MSEKQKRVTALEAFGVYSRLKQPRSILQLHRKLKDDGYASSRNVLAKWAAEEGWDQRLSPKTKNVPTEMNIAAAVAFRAAEELGSNADNALEALDTLGLFTKQLTGYAATFIGQFEITTLDDFIRLADCCRFLTKAVVESKVAVAGIRAPNGDDARIIEAMPGDSAVDRALDAFINGPAKR